MAEKRVGIALLGSGVVGSGVLQILQEQAELIARRSGVRAEIRHVVVRDVSKYSRDLPVTTDLRGAINDPKVEMVVEVMGGTTTACDAVEMALKAGKPVVTANKSLLASRGPELFELARKHNTCIAFEASCAGGIPIINAMMQGLIANRIDALVGIVNGTCNFILTQMTRHRQSYADALKGAQQAGYAEADPSMDVQGRDAAQKLALLSSLAFNVLVKESDIEIEGIDKLDAADIKYAGELGYVIKLLAIAQRHGEKLSLRVHPTLVHQDDVLAEVSGSFNAVSIFGSAVGHSLFYGRGAGKLPTASAVVADIINTAMGVTDVAFKQLQVFPDALKATTVLPIDELTSRYYLRMMIKDEPGVLAQITKVLGHHKISLASFLQHEVTGAGAVPIVLTTHAAKEGAMRLALKEINHLPPIMSQAVCLRIVDQPKEFATS